MKSVHKMLALFLALGLLPVVSGCTPSAPNEPTETTPSTPDPNSTTAGEDTQSPPRETYEDLSFRVPDYTDPGTKSRTVQTEGSELGSGIKLDFTALSGLYVITPTKIKESCHDVASCDTCGYVETPDGGAYLISSEGLNQGGITVTLATPIAASSVTGMTLTFKTTADASASSMRILSKDQTNNAAFVNDCPSMSGATEEWITIDLGIENYTELADSDGYIRGFQMYFRNKNKTDCLIQSIDIAIGPEQQLTVEEITGNCFHHQGAVDAVAEVLASRFTAAGIRASIEVKGVRFRKNSTSTDGSLIYKATATLPDGTVLEAQHEVKIPAITGAWLDTTDGKYGSSHDSLGQWQTTFDPAGILFLTDNRLSCAEGVSQVEYAVVSRETAYDSRETEWHAPHMLAMNQDGFSHLLVNAFLDYGEALTEGGQYRLLVRGVSKRNNYILHLDIPFVYSPLSKDATQALSGAQKALENARMICGGSATDKEAAIKEQIAALLQDDRIAADVLVLGEGIQSMRIQVSLRYTQAITASRLPAYTLDGTVLTDLYNHAGLAFFSEGLTVPYSDQVSSINLITPYDGDRHVILAADCIYDHAKAPLASIQSAHYGYVQNELCTPPPVSLTWSDTNGGEGTAYTVLLSTERDMSEALTYEVVGTALDVYNLNIGTQYYWQVKTKDASSPVQTFITEDGYPRFVKLDGVSNVRDIGGFITADGKRIRQNLAYRSAQPEGITEEGLKVALEQLKIRTDLDLRGGHARPLGNTVQLVSVPMQWYEHIFEEDMHEHVRKTISTFAYEENYPILFHCSLGRDRTGTTAFLILGLLGVDEDTLRHEYFASFFSLDGRFDEAEFPLLVANINRLVTEMNAYGGKDDPLSERIELYLLDIGVTAAEIQSIRDIWLED